jgi:signal transduction histidine kinase
MVAKTELSAGPMRTSGRDISGESSVPAEPPDEVLRRELPDPPQPELAELGVARPLVIMIAIAGIGVLAYSVVSGIETIAAAGVVYWLFAVLLILGECFPITAPRRAEADAEEITTSTTFAFALLILYGTGPACLALGLGSIIGDLRQHKSIWKTLYNVAQYMLALGAAGGVYALCGAPNHVSVAHLPAIATAGFVFYLVNEALVWVAVGLPHGESLVRYVTQDFFFQIWTAAALVALAPILVITAERSPFLVPLIAVPVAAVYWGATASLRNTNLVARLEESLEHRQEANRLKDDFVAVVSHELRTPLTSIQGYVKTLLQLAGDLDVDQQRSFLEAADRQSERLRRLIEQLLVVSRLETHVEPLTITTFSLRGLARQVVDELRVTANGQVFDLRFEELSPPVETDESKIRQILSNLIENAIKYSPPDSRITIREVGGEDGRTIFVEDEGGGIPEAARERVFERFYQVDSSSTRRVGGTGLGLYICSKMADSIGARLWLDRSDDDGSTFCLAIPAAPPPDADTGDPEPSQEDRPAVSQLDGVIQSMTARA